MDHLRRTIIYDRAAALPLMGWYLFGLMRQGPLLQRRFGQLSGGRISLIDFMQLVALMGSALLVFLLVFLLVSRKLPELRSKGPWPRIAAIAGTFLGNAFLYLDAVELSVPTQVLADLLIIGGIAGSLYALFRLGPAFSLLPEARKLVMTGPYRIIRHPLYLFEMVGILGLVLQFQQPWAFVLGVAVFAFQYWRTVNEERVLMEAYPEYAAYRIKTPRFIPRLLRTEKN